MDRRPRPVGALALAAGLLSAAAAANALPALAAPLPSLRPALGVGDRTGVAGTYALTFDDGPHPQATPEVLRLLDRAGARATFFLVGEQVARDRGLAAEIAAAGHTVGLHCHRHRNLLRLVPHQVRSDLDRALGEIAAATGELPTLHRPPYGILSLAVLREVRRRGWRTLLWTRWGRDWEARATPDSVHALLTRADAEQAVMLLHDADHYGAPGCWRATVGALPRVLETMAGRGLRPVAL